jgi:hypothetical protein
MYWRARRDGLRQAGLADEQARGRPPEVQFLGHHGEVAQMPELDISGLADRRSIGHRVHPQAGARRRLPRITGPRTIAFGPVRNRDHVWGGAQLVGFGLI